MNFIKRFFNTINQEAMTKNQKKQRYAILLFSEALIVFFMLFITASDFFNKNAGYEIFSTTLLILYSISLIFTFLQKGNGISNVFLCCTIALNFLYSFYIRGNTGIGSIWLLLLPMLTMYVVGLSYGFYSSLFATAGLISLLAIPYTRNNILSLYSIHFLIRYSILYIVGFFLSTISMINFHNLRIKENIRHEQLLDAVQQEHNKVVTISMQTILAINNVVEAKNIYVGKHSLRVAHFSCYIGEKLGWSEEEIKRLHTIAMLHDIGKIGIESSILNKELNLTDEEFEEMKKHTIIGGRILKDLTIIPNANLVANYHHEYFDGNGYPEALKGNQIPIEARIVCIADSFDSMKYPRVYKDQLSNSQIKEELLNGKGKQFDPELIDIFIQVCNENDWFDNYEV